MKLKQEFNKFQQLYNDGFRFNPDENTFFTIDKKTFKLPQGFEDWEIVEFDRNKYLNDRLKELGVKPEQNKINLLDTKGNQSKTKGEFQIFTANEYGDIEILQYSLEGETHCKAKKNSKNTNHQQYCAQIRLNPNNEFICEGKYNFSDGINAPFWHPNLVKAYKEDEEIPTLVITEGQFKAFKATNDGIPTVGLTSISHFRDGATNEIHSELIKFIQKCKVKKVIILWDADCMDISTSALKEEKDLAERPYNFMNFANKIKVGLIKYINTKGFQIHYCTIAKLESWDIQPKGIDDLLIELKSGKVLKKEIDNIGILPTVYLRAENITTDGDGKKLKAFFRLHSISAFYEYHAEKILNHKFTFFKNTYSLQEGKLVLEISSDLKKYIRVGDGYYERVDKPFQSPSGKMLYEEVLLSRMKGTVVDDHGRDQIKHVTTFKDFVNIAEHINYQQIIDGKFWNLYFEVDHKPVEGSWEHIEALLKHIFTDQYTMILDYITILYLYPIQKLPVICLTSKENKTGKSTFVYLMKLIFANNMMYITSEDFIEPFNDHWITKLLVACEETVFDKKEAYEKIKRYTTAQFNPRKEKGKSASQVSNMLHMIFCSNHEDDFIKIDDSDSRLWITKVKSITNTIVDLEAKMENEIPAFVHFITNRKIENPKIDRLWFHPDQFQTEAFKNLVKHSEPEIIKEIREALTDSFMKWGGITRELTSKDLRVYFGIKANDTWIRKAVKNYLKTEVIKNAKGQEYVTTYKFPVDEHETTKCKYINGKGRPFQFYVKDFLSDEQIKEMPEVKNSPF